MLFSALGISLNVVPQEVAAEHLASLSLRQPKSPARLRLARRRIPLTGSLMDDEDGGCTGGSCGPMAKSHRHASNASNDRRMLIASSAQQNS